MSQLTLGLSPRLSYAPEHFYLHRGVDTLLDDLTALVEREEFATAFVEGAPRRGKTHLTIYFAEQLLRVGKIPKIVEGESFDQWMREITVSHRFNRDDVVLVDDAHLYFQAIAPGCSGAFVNLVETLRVARSNLLLFSREPVASFPCDDHIRSRLNPGEGFMIGTPGESDMEPLVTRMARQRGIHLTDSKVEYLTKRLRRDVASIEEYLEKVVHLSTVLGASVKFPLLADAIDAD